MVCNHGFSVTVTVTHDFVTVLTVAATPNINVPSLRTATLIRSAWHGHLVTVMHTFSGITIVTSVLHPGDALISLSGLDVEPKRERHIVSACLYSRLTCLSHTE